MENNMKQRMRILYVLKILMEETDEDHALTMPQLIDKLDECGVTAARKAIYDDINALKDFGYDIQVGKGSGAGYSMVSREFELPELTLLADAVSSSKFITQKKSQELIRKLEKLSSKYEAAGIDRQVFVADRVKAVNEKIYINIDVIHRAIARKKQIRFKYFDYNANMIKVFREGDRVCSPYALTWSDEHYYLVAHYEKYPDNYTNFRVDRMENVEMLDERSIRPNGNINLSRYLNATFSMFSGKSEIVTLRFEKHLMNPVIDRFGYDIDPMPEDDEHFTLKVCVKTEQPMPFFAWLFQFGKQASIVSPPELKDRYIQALDDVMNDLKQKLT